MAGTGRPIRLVLLRHSKSCANHMRAVAGSHDPAHPLVAASQRVRDPALSEVGRAMARAYGPTLRRRLAAEGFPVAGALIASSGLRRAASTAALLFPGRSVTTLPHIMEHGEIPENTPRQTQRRRCRPSWRLFLRNLATRCETDIVAVAHGSFLRDEVWPAVAPTHRPHGRLENLAGFLVEGDLSPTGRLEVERLVELPYTGAISPSRTADRCGRDVEATITTHLPKSSAFSRKQMPSRRHHYRRGRKTHHRRRGQKGGATPMPLAYYQPGAQMLRTSADPTGTGLAATNATWARAPLPRQAGGWLAPPPSIMSAFVANGSRFLPVAAYMGYRQARSTNKRGKI